MRTLALLGEPLVFGSQVLTEGGSTMYESVF